MPRIRVPDISKASDEDEVLDGGLEGFESKEYEVSSSKAANWNRLNDKEKLTLVLKADREGRDIRDYL